MRITQPFRAFLVVLRTVSFGIVIALTFSNSALASFTTFEGAGATPADITPFRDAFRTAVGGGTTAGANGDFGGLRREINWDGVPAGSSDPNLMPVDFFNVNSPRGTVFSTPGTGFLVSSTPGSILFGFPNDLQTFSPPKLFAPVNSTVTDVNFFVPGTTTAATTTAFAAIFVDVENAGSTQIQFFDAANNLLYSRTALTAGNQGLSFVGAVANSGEKIARVRLTSGSDPLISNGVRANETDDFVVMDDFLYATPTASASAVPEPSSVVLFSLGIAALWAGRRNFTR